MVLTAADVARLYDLSPTMLYESDPGLLMMQMTAEWMIAGPAVGGQVEIEQEEGGRMLRLPLEAERDMVRRLRGPRRVTPPASPRARPP